MTGTRGDLAPGSGRAAPGRLAGRRVVIVGVGSGRGEIAQLAFLRAGAVVAGCDARRGAAERAAGQLEASGFEVTGRTVDIGDPGAVARWIDRVAARLGGVDVLYNGAVAGHGPTGFDEVAAITHATGAAWRHLRAGGRGVVINAVPAGRAADGVIALTRTLAVEGAANDVRVNAIAGAAPAGAADARPFRVGMHVVRRFGTGDDRACLALYLAADGSSWVTGRVAVVDGGMTVGFH